MKESLCDLQLPRTSEFLLHFMKNMRLHNVGIKIKVLKEKILNKKVKF